MNWKTALLNSNPYFGSVCGSSELPSCSAVQLFKCFTTDNVIKKKPVILFWYCFGFFGCCLVRFWFVFFFSDKYFPFIEQDHFNGACFSLLGNNQPTNNLTGQHQFHSAGGILQHVLSHRPHMATLCTTTKKKDRQKRACDSKSHHLKSPQRLFREQNIPYTCYTKAQKVMSDTSHFHFFGKIWCHHTSLLCH